jgi:hypothetical protein
MQQQQDSELGSNIVGCRNDRGEHIKRVDKRSVGARKCVGTGIGGCIGASRRQGHVDLLEWIYGR